jgi:DNA-binding CsgD family transcriptional regulator
VLSLSLLPEHAGADLPHATTVRSARDAPGDGVPLAAAARSGRVTRTDRHPGGARSDGHIAHAEVGARAAPAREALAFAVRAREVLRRETPAEPAPVLRSWRGLVAARWTLVDHFERGGRRFVLARENAPLGTGPAALSMRERQVASLAALGRSNKLIAYELGLAHSTIRVIVARACAKLEVPSRRALVARLTASQLTSRV